MTRYANYSPNFAVRINGKSLPAAVQSAVTGVTYQDGRNAADRAEINLANPNLRWLQQHIQGLGIRPFPTGVNIGPVVLPDAAPKGTFDLGNPFSLSMGYAPDPPEPMFEGEVTGVNVSFPNGGMPSMTLIAHDKLHRLSQGTGAGGFGFLPDMVVAIIVSAKNRLVPLIDPSVAAASTALAVLDAVFKGTGEKQGGPARGESDMNFIRRLAAKYDAEFWVEGDLLYMSRFIKEYKPRLSLTWGQNLMDFSPRISTVGQVAGVSMKFTLREIPLNFQVTVFWDFVKERLGFSVVPGAAASSGAINDGPNLTILDQPISSPADIAGSALIILNKLRQKLNSRLTGSGTALGDPRIRAGALVRLEGLGPDFSQDYRITSATHSIDSGGWTTRFEVQKEIIP